MQQKPDRETLEKWSRDPKNWKMGFFYYNKEDKRLLPPKKIPAMGWTVNFANPYSIFLFVLILLICLCLPLLIACFS